MRTLHFFLVLFPLLIQFKSAYSQQTELIIPAGKSLEEQNVNFDLEEGLKRTGNVTFKGLNELTSFTNKSRTDKSLTKVFTIKPFHDATTFILTLGSPSDEDTEHAMWSGSTDEPSEGKYVIVYGKNNTIAISLFSISGNFSIYTTLESLSKIDQEGSLIAEEADETSPFNCEADEVVIKTTADEKRQKPREKNLESKVITVLMLYTEKAKKDLGGEDNTITKLKTAAKLTNFCFDNSGIEKTTIKPIILPTNFVEQHSYGDDLDRIKANSVMKQLRATHKADVVSLMRTKGSSWGIASVLSNLKPYQKNHAYNVVYAKQASTTWIVFAHELGHNMGCNHNRKSATATPLFSDSYGWYFRALHNGKVRTVGTVMSYEGVRIPYYSNPSVKFPPSGNPQAPTGKAGSANNSRAITASRAFIASHF